MWQFWLPECTPPPREGWGGCCSTAAVSGELEEPEERREHALAEAECAQVTESAWACGYYLS